MNETKSNTWTGEQSSRLKRYIRYVYQRPLYFNLGLLEPSEYEFHFYDELKTKIREWGIEHDIFYKMLFGRMTYKKGMEALGYPDFSGTNQRKYFRCMTKQRNELIANIQTWEKELFKKYPFKSSGLEGYYVEWRELRLPETVDKRYII